MPERKAVGPYGIPSEVIKLSTPVREALFLIIDTTWRNEHLPDGFAQAKFIILYKNKGSPNDLTKYAYRCIALLNHVLSTSIQNPCEDNAHTLARLE